MKIYPPKLEEQIYLHKKGLISEEPPVKRTNIWIRLLLTGFTLLCMGATVGFFMLLFGAIGTGTILLFLSVPFYFLGDFLIRRNQLYRFGTEEALTLGGAALACSALAIFTDQLFSLNELEAAIIAVCIAVIYFLVYRRLGHFLSALISLTAMGTVPFILMDSEQTARLSCVAFIIICFTANAWILPQLKWNFERARHRGFEAVLVAAAYGLLNLRMESIFQKSTIAYYSATAGHPEWFYWLTYVAIIGIPLAALAYGLKTKRRTLIDVSLILFLITILTNKSYLSKPRYDWDPMILGAVLMALALLVQRWVTKKGAKCGYTAEKVKGIDTSGLDLMSLGPVLTHTATPSAGKSSPFSGGESGGGGADRSF